MSEPRDFDLRHPVPPPEQDFAARMQYDPKCYNFMASVQRRVLRDQMRVVRNGIPPHAILGGAAERLVMKISQRELKLRIHQLEATGTCHFNGPQMLKIALLFGVGFRMEFCPFEEMILDWRSIRDGGKLGGLTRPTERQLRAWLASHPDDGSDEPLE